MQEGRLVEVARGLYAHPVATRWGAAPPTDAEMMRSFLEGGPFVFTGPDRWNALGLGTTALFAAPLVYNTKRSGTFHLGGRPFVLHRVAFPPDPPPEWFVVDLFEHAEQAGSSRPDLVRALAQAVASGRFDAERLRELALRYGTGTTRGYIGTVLNGNGSSKHQVITPFAPP